MTVPLYPETNNSAQWLTVTVTVTVTVTGTVTVAGTVVATWMPQAGLLPVECSIALQYAARRAQVPDEDAFEVSAT